jgi:hypothetical protein
MLTGKLAIKAGLHTIRTAMVKNALAIIISLFDLMMESMAKAIGKTPLHER